MSKTAAIKTKKVTTASKKHTAAKGKATVNATAKSPKKATVRTSAAKTNGTPRRAKATLSAPPASPAIQRLGTGELRQQVKAFLAQHPGEYFTPVQVRKAIDARSAGGVWLAMERLVALDEATKASDPPQRYRIRATKGAKRSAKR